MNQRIPGSRKTLLRRDSPLAKNLFIPLSDKILQETPPSPNLYCTLNKSFSCNHPIQSLLIALFIFAVSFFNLKHIHAHVMLISTLIDVQYLQNAVLNIEKSWNGWNYSSAGSCHLIKKIPQENSPFFSLGTPPRPFMLFGKPWF